MIKIFPIFSLYCRRRFKQNLLLTYVVTNFLKLAVFTAFPFQQLTLAKHFFNKNKWNFLFTWVVTKTLKTSCPMHWSITIRCYRFASSLHKRHLPPASVQYFMYPYMLIQYQRKRTWDCNQFFCAQLSG